MQHIPPSSHSWSHFSSCSSLDITSCEARQDQGIDFIPPFFLPFYVTLAEILFLAFAFRSK
jgi:hypothetical protein